MDEGNSPSKITAALGKRGPNASGSGPPEHPTISETSQPRSDNNTFAPLIYAAPTADSNSEFSNDSAIASLASTRSASLTSSIFNYREANGRTYHAQRDSVDYALPNDEQELDRLDLQHHLFNITLDGSLHRSPLAEDVQNVLDIGTGTGIYAIDFADRYPSATVIGTDVSPVQPHYVPANCHFYIDNAEGEWNFPEKFDFIHGRMLVVAIRDWVKLFKQAFDNMKPGGWIEMQDLNYPARCNDGTADSSHPLMEWSALIWQAAANLGVDLGATERFPQLLKEAGFEDVHVETHAWPLGRWPKDKKEKEKGMWVQQNFSEGLHGFSMAFFTRGLGWQREEVEDLIAKVRESVKGKKRGHIYLPIGVFYARKPDAAA